jgi:hypothetical protein
VGLLQTAVVAGLAGGVQVTPMLEMHCSVVSSPQSTLDDPELEPDVVPVVPVTDPELDPVVVPEPVVVPPDEVMVPLLVPPPWRTAVNMHVPEVALLQVPVTMPPNTVP